MKKRTRTVLIVLGVVVLFVVIAVANRSRKAGGDAVDTTRAKYGSIRSEVTATGELRAQDQVNIQAQVMGIVERLRVSEGQWVNRGDLLLELDRRSYEANLVLARSRSTQARLSHARVESLYGRGLVAAETYEASQAARDMAEAQLSQAQDQFDKTSIRAPISGTVVQLNIKEGEAVMIGTMNYAGTVLMVLADMSRMQALIDVDETDVVNCELGQLAEVEVDALTGDVFPARVTRIGFMPVQSLLSTATQQGTDFEVELTLDTATAALRPGMSVHSTIVTAELDSVLVV
ncbi:efflux RND transporter periplasmic adaptor subunit, partial [candidate division WOR-3 bacterium]|nr:efflux RND transporter periplasmic adaptor subunit [candidate division WOR-3 bacterium]